MNLEMRPSRLRPKNKVELTEAETNKAIAGIMNYQMDLLTLQPLELASLFDATMNDPTIVRQNKRLRIGKKLYESDDWSRNKKDIYEAFNTAFDAHQTFGDQWRKFSGQPYIVHPMRVALLSIKLAQAMGIPVTPELIIAGLGHDVIEDSVQFHGQNRLFKDLNLKSSSNMRKKRRTKFVADMDALSHHDVHVDGKVDEQLYYEKIIYGDEQAILRRKIVKTADKMENLLDPPNLPSSYGSLVTPTTELAGKVNKQRRKYIGEVENDNGVVNYLLDEGSFLKKAVQKAKDIAKQTIYDPLFTLDALRQQLANTMQVHVSELQAMRYQPPNIVYLSQATWRTATSRLANLFPESRVA